MIQCIANTTVHSGIGISPAQLVFASHADLDRGILFDWAPPNEQVAADPPVSANAFVAELFRVQAQVLETAFAMQLARNAQNLAAQSGYADCGSVGDP
jgi:hypothetical protein